MPINKQQKQRIVESLQEKIARAKSVVFTRYQGVNANDINDLRSSFRKAGSEYVVAKKTLMDIAFSKSDISGVNAKDLSGEVAAVFGFEDEVAPAKILSDFAKNHEQLSIVGGVLEKKFIDAAQVQSLANLPSKLELYAQVVGSLNAPISGFVNVLAGNLRGLVTVLKAIEAKKS